MITSLNLVGVPLLPSGFTLRRLLRGSGLAGGFQRAKKFNDVVATVVDLAFPFQDECLTVQSGYTSPTPTTTLAQPVDTGWRGRSPGALLIV